jgi:hypothetical protein
MDHLLDEQGPRPLHGEGPADADERKLPVLFHLMDVSRRRARQAAVQPADLAACVPAAHAAGAVEPELVLAPLPASPPGPIAEFAALEKPVTNPFIPAASTVPTPETPAIPDPLPAATPVAVVTAQIAEPVKAEAPKPKAEHSVSLPPVRQANRRQKVAAADDWFAAHGKFIAVAFVLALIGTIYFARTSRRPVKQEEAVRPVAPLIELASVSEQKSTPPSTAASTSAPTLASATVAAPASATPASVELHLPVAPAAQVAATNERRSGSDSLFVFPANKPQDERLAARPETAANASPPASQVTAPTTATMPPAYPVTSSPAIYSAAAAYPQTAAPPLATANPPGAYQAMSPPAGPPLPTVAPAAAYGQSIPYQTPDNVARGPRYEPTGSGHY